LLQHLDGAVVVHPVPALAGSHGAVNELEILPDVDIGS
jgi:hypothetical protein